MSYTIADFMQQLAALDVNGVIRKLASPPDRIASADLPLQFVAPPTADVNAISFTSVMGLRSITCDLVIIVAPSASNRTSENVSAAVALADAVHVALAQSAASFGIDEFAINISEQQFAEAVFWVVTTTVTGSGV
jgi:hypothetical protein